VKGVKDVAQGIRSSGQRLAADVQGRHSCVLTNHALRIWEMGEKEGEERRWRRVIS
jgi:hypothetical protein